MADWPDLARVRVYVPARLDLYLPLRNLFDPHLDRHRIEVKAMTDRLLPASEVAEMLSLSIRTVQDMMRKRELPSCQVTKRRRMVPEGALKAWIKQNTDWPDPSSTGSNRGSGTFSSDRTAENVAYLHAKQTDTPLNDG